jgi:4-amino-4-deoxy-L-arabinose transferase-like glycosyltransferase
VLVFASERKWGAEGGLVSRSRTIAIGLGVLGALVYVLWLGTRDFWYPGEPDLAEISRAMFASGDWIVPRRNGEVFLNYGPLFFWASTFASHLLGGMSEFALRLPNALAAVAVVVATSLVGSRWFGTRAGLWAGL